MDKNSANVNSSALATKKHPYPTLIPLSMTIKYTKEIKR
jgi:hypothetical protein